MSGTNAPVSNKAGATSPKRRTGLIVAVIVAVVAIIAGVIFIPPLFAETPPGR